MWIMETPILWTKIALDFSSKFLNKLPCSAPQRRGDETILFNPKNVFVLIDKNITSLHSNCIIF